MKFEFLKMLEIIGGLRGISEIFGDFQGLRDSNQKRGRVEKETIFVDILTCFAYIVLGLSRQVPVNCRWSFYLSKPFFMCGIMYR